MKLSNFSCTEWSMPIFWELFSDQKQKKNKGKPDLLFSDVSSRNFFHEPIKIVIHVSISDLRNNKTVFHWPASPLLFLCPSCLSVASQSPARAWYRGFAGPPTWSTWSSTYKFVLENHYILLFPVLVAKLIRGSEIITIGNYQPNDFKFLLAREPHKGCEPRIPRTDSIKFKSSTRCLWWLGS